MRNRYHVGADIPPFSADGTAVIRDGHSDNDDVLVHVDPSAILTDQARQRLAKIVAAALNKAKFEPDYPG